MFKLILVNVIRTKMTCAGSFSDFCHNMLDSHIDILSDNTSVHAICAQGHLANCY